MDYENKSFKEVLTEDLKYCMDIIKREKRNVWYNRDMGVWYIGEDEIVDYLWYNENTILNPKELVGYIEKYINEETNLADNNDIIINVNTIIREILETQMSHIKTIEVDL